MLKMLISSVFNMLSLLIEQFSFTPSLKFASICFSFLSSRKQLLL